HRVGALTRGACAPSLSPDGNVTKTIRIRGDRGVPRRRGPLRYRRLEVADPPRRRPQSRKAAEIADRVDVSAGRRKGRLTTNEMGSMRARLPHGRGKHEEAESDRRTSWPFQG